MWTKLIESLPMILQRLLYPSWKRRAIMPLDPRVDAALREWANTQLDAHFAHGGLREARIATQAFVREHLSHPASNATMLTLEQPPLAAA